MPRGIAMSIYKGNKSQISEVADYICDYSRITRTNTDVVTLTGENGATNDLHVVENWVAEQTDMIGTVMDLVKETLLYRFRDFIEECFEEAMDRAFWGSE